MTIDPAPTTRQEARKVLRDRLAQVTGETIEDGKFQFPMPWSSLSREFMDGACIVYRLCPCGCGTYDIAATSHQL